MAEITAGMVKELRELTGLGMMECKKALEEAGGDLKKAEELLRIKSGAKASKAASRVAADGAIGTYLEGNVGALVEVNAETDFVAKNPDFIEFTSKLAELVAKQDPADVAALSEMKIGGEILRARFHNFKANDVGAFITRKPSAPAAAGERFRLARARATGRRRPP